MQQCHKCQHYGHLGNRCHAPIKCAVCAGNHQSRSCLVMKNGGEYKCPLCNGAHTSYDPACPQRQKQVDAVLKTRKERPSRFSTQLQPKPTAGSCETAHVPKPPDSKIDNAATMPASIHTSTTSNVSIQLDYPSIPEPVSQEHQATETGSCQASTATPKEADRMFTIYEDIDPEFLVPTLNPSSPTTCLPFKDAQSVIDRHLLDLPSPSGNLQPNYGSYF